MYETWANNSTNFEINGFKSFNFYRKCQNKRARRNSGGVAVIISDGVRVVKFCFDTIIWLKLDKHFFNLQNDIHIAGVYIWVESSPYYNVVNVDLFQTLQEDIYNFDTLGSVLLCGDFNARVGDGSKCDFIACDNSLDSDQRDYIIDVPLYRYSMDKGSNSYGLKLLDTCKSTGLRIANGRLFTDHGVGNFTYASKNGASVIDYLLLQQKDFHILTNFRINPFCEWSDLSSVNFVIKCNTHFDTNFIHDANFSRLKWNDNFRDEFRSRIILYLPSFNDIVDSLPESCTYNDIDNCILQFSQILDEIGRSLFENRICTGSYNTDNSLNIKKADWFDDECRNAKQIYRQSLQNYNLSKTKRNRVDMCDKKALYKKIVAKKKRLHEHKKLKKIESLKNTNPRNFWKLFSKKKSVGRLLQIFFQL